MIVTIPTLVTLLSPALLPVPVVGLPPALVAAWLLSPALVAAWLLSPALVAGWLLSPALVAAPLVGLVEGVLFAIVGVIGLEGQFWLHGFVLGLVVGDGNAVDFGVVVVEFVKLDGHGVVLVDEFEAEADLFVGYLDGVAAEFLHEEGELVEGEAPLLLVEVVEDLPQGEFVPRDDLAQLRKTVLDLGAGLGRNAVEGLAFFALEGGHRLELPVELDAVLQQHVLEFADRDGGGVVGVGLLEAVVGLLSGDLGVDLPQEVVEVLETDLVDLLGEPHRIQDHLQVQVVLVYVEPQLVQDHLQLVLELTVVRPRQELPPENRVREDLVPTYPVLLVQLQAPPQEVHRLRREVLPLNVQRDLLDVADQLQLRVGSPGSVPVQELVEDEAQGPDVALAGVLLALEDLEGHVERRSDGGGHHLRLALHLLGKAEVAEFEEFALLHDVGRFEVSVDDAFLDEGQEAVADLPEHVDGFRFLALVVAFDLLGDVSVAELLDDVVIFGALHDVVEGHHVVGVQLLKDIDLVFEGSLEVVVLVDCMGDGVLLYLGRILTATCSPLAYLRPM